MKRVFFATPLLIIVLTLISAGTAHNKTPRYVLSNPDIQGCAPSLNSITADVSGKFINVLPGWGRYSYNISTNNDSTQFYFNQGLNFYYSYHFREALASFKEASRFDSSCAMTYWGQALSMGPSYNDYYYKMKKGIIDVILAMNKFMAAAPEKEKALINAMQKRYSNDTTNADRRLLDSNYAGAMFSLTKQYATDNDIKALYLDAVMLEHKWDFWNNDGNPKPWTTELVKLCETILKKNPAHPAALHYYIHLTEASQHPELALHGADILKDAMPGVGHMVHMSTHMYQRNGLYIKGVRVNEDANAANNNIDSLAPNLGIGKNSSVHIFSVQSSCAMTAGMFNKGMPLYLRTRKKILDIKSVANETYLQYMYMIPVMAWARLGKWELILKSAPPDASWKYASLLDNFAKGLASIRTKDLKTAKKCLSSIDEYLTDSQLAVRQMPFNKPVDCGKIAAGILRGEISTEEGKSTEGITSLELAVEEESKLIYREPQDWPIPARQYLGALLLKMNRTKEAEKVYREDLIANPGNGWSSLGLYNSLLAQNKKKEAAIFKGKYLKAFQHADVHPVASVF